jgi:uncharacterized protein YqjF (DUF2071 family)
VAGPVAEQQISVPLAVQDWRSVTFLHWDYDPDAVAALLPEGLVPDTYDGRAWVGLTPFKVRNFRVPPAPPLPYLSDYPETNVRTYVRGPNGVDGLYFFTLEVDSLATVLSVRPGLGIPYRWAAMAVGETPDGAARYESRRRTDPTVGHTIEIRPGGELARSDLTTFLTGRWRAYTRIAGRLVTMPVAHQPWPLREATVVRLDETLIADCGLVRPDRPPLVHWSPGVDARFGPPQLPQTYRR